MNFRLKRIEFYECAFTHKSYKSEAYVFSGYERLEFLGDAILNAVVAQYLFREMPNASEGNLTKMRSKIVCRESLNNLGREYDLMKFLKHNMAIHELKDDIYGNTMEALIGAIFVDRGYSKTKQFIYRRVLDHFLDLKALDNKVENFKSTLIEYCQKHKLNYHFNTSGVGNGGFVSCLMIRDKNFEGKGSSKKQAEVEVSKVAYLNISKATNVSFSQKTTQ